MIVLTYLSRPSSPALANHRRYAAAFGYRHRLVDASSVHDSNQVRVIDKYETLLTILWGVPENTLVLLLTENVAILTMVPIERLMIDRDRLLVRAQSGRPEPFTDLQIWRNTPASRDVLLRKTIALHLRHEPGPEEYDLMSDCADIDYFEMINGHYVVVPTGYNFDPVWAARSDVFAICLGDKPIGAGHDPFPRDIWRSPRFNDALVVEPQQVVLGEAEATDWRLVFYPAMGAMPVVSVHPDGQLVGALV